ncbi:MAG: HD domain-containing protein [Prevotella sp.]|jgi:uncharacterized protein
MKETDLEVSNNKELSGPESPWVTALINKYYPENNALKALYLRHSRDVRDLALKLCDRHPELGMNRQFVADAAMLHDIGIFRCHAPKIYCYGDEHYLLHGRIGAELMRAEGHEDIARVCERHTGAGLTKEEIEEQQLPLPPQDFLPETLEEQLVCYADKFYSKSNLDRKKTMEQAEKSIARFGRDGLARFLKWKKTFE